MEDCKYPMYPLEVVPMKDIEELMELYHMQIGSEGCTWDEAYPDWELVEQDIREKRVFCVRNESGTIIAAITWDMDAVVAGLSCWDASLHKTAEYARLCIHPNYQHKGLTCSLFWGSEKRLKAEGYDGAHYIVSQSNPRALRAYEKFGFEYKGEVRLFDHDWYAYEKAF